MTTIAAILAMASVRGAPPRNRSPTPTIAGLGQQAQLRVEQGQHSQRCSYHAGGRFPTSARRESEARTETERQG